MIKNKMLYKVACLVFSFAIAAASLAGCGGAFTGGSGDTGGGGAAETQDGGAADSQGANATQAAQPGGGAAPGSSNAAQNSEPVVIEDGEISGTLRVSTYDSMVYGGVLETVAQAFNEKYPDVEIIVDTFSSMPEIRRQESADGRTFAMAVAMEDNPQERADYANKINTELMSGEGADILAVDVIPIAKYVESGLLENLAPYMEQDPGFNMGDYRANILDAVTWKGGTWFLPMDYMYNYFTYDTTLLPDMEDDFGTGFSFTTEQLMELAIPMFDGETMLLNVPAYTKGMGGSAWSRILRERWSEFVDVANKKAYFNDGRFAELLEAVKSYGKDGYIPDILSGQPDREEVMARFGQEPTDRYYFKPKGNMQLLTYYLSTPGRGFNIGVSVNMGMAIEEDDEIAGIAANADGSVPFTYTQAYAINSNSKNKQAAWELIKYMLSGEMQLSGAVGILRGLPIHNETRAKQMEIMVSSMAAGMRGSAAFGAAGTYGRAPAGPGGFSLSPATPGGGPGGAAAAPGGAGGGPGGAVAAPGGARTPQSPDSPVIQAVPEDDEAEGEGTRRMDAAVAELDPETVRKYNEATEKFSDQINTFEIKDAIIDDMIATEADYFFEGAKTAEEVAATLQSKVELYLNE